MPSPAVDPNEPDRVIDEGPSDDSLRDPAKLSSEFVSIAPAVAAAVFFVGGLAALYRAFSHPSPVSDLPFNLAWLLAGASSIAVSILFLVAGQIVWRLSQIVWLLGDDRARRAFLKIDD
ncbi:MAG: hypothetical protein GC208_09755 [Alphaproteobacteria bacterium]|nr:hypothetical protein [Alphaproteobacteria bacterium]